MFGGELFSKQDLEKIKGKTKEIKKVTRDDIAIIGISGKFGIANNLQEYWELLANGQCSVRRFPNNRKHCLIGPFQMKQQEKNLLPASYLDTIDEFDYEFFGLSLRESRTMDPAQRLLLQTIWETLEDAGYVQDNIRGTNTGVYVGYSNDHKIDYYNYLQLLDPKAKEEASLTGNVTSVLSSRIAYLLDLKGPSMVVDTACSSALVSIHLACKALQNYECDMAICGGVNVDILPIFKGVDDITGIRSPKNRLRAFDDAADGIASGEGMGAILLKPLEKAVAHNDHIYAVIKGSAINQDGNSIGLTAPNASAQASAMVKAWKKAKVDPTKISYIEAHGTGTKLGDPIEMEGIELAFRQYTKRTGFCGIGSVKTNIGHLDSAAGMGSILKVILMLKNKKLVPSIHFTRPNHNIDFMNSPVYVCDSYKEWSQEKEEPLCCGINAFGLSGTNCHMVLEEYKEKKTSGVEDESTCEYVFTVSAKNEVAVRQLVQRYLLQLRNDTAYAIKDICYTSTMGRKHMEFRLACLVQSKQELIEKLEHWYTGMETPMQGLYVGTFKLVSDQKQELDTNELTDAKREELSARSQRLLNQMKEDTHCVYEEIGRLYVQGAEIPWYYFYNKKSCKKVSLPTYPFKKVSCWGRAKEFGHLVPTNENYPLLNGEMFETLDEIVYISCFNQENWVIGEHVVDGKYVLPGTAYIEILTEIQKQRSDWGYGIQIKNMTFLHQFSVKEEETKALQTILKGNQGEYQFTIVSKEEGSSTWVVHAEGSLCVLEENVTLERIPMEEYLSSSLTEITKIPYNEVVHIGAHWNEIEKKVYQKGETYVVPFEMSKRYQEDVTSYSYYPSLMDRGVNSIVDVLKEGTYYLPYTYGELVLVRDLPSKFYSIVTVVGEKREEVARLEVSLCDEMGEVVAVAHNYVVKSVRSSKVQTKLTPLEVQWKKVSNIVETMEPPKQVLVIGQGKSVAELMKLLKSVGVKKPMGACFDSYGTEDIKSVQSKEEFELLAKEIKENISDIVYIGDDRTDTKVSLTEFDKKQKETLESVFLFIQTLIQANVTKQLRLLFLLRGAYEVITADGNVQPFQTALAALSKVVHQEYGNIQTKVVDVTTLQEEVIVSELVSGWDKQMIAYRNQDKYEQILGEVKEAKFLEYGKYQTEGIYVITGGLGALALETAIYMAKQSPIQIALLSRRTFADRSKWDEVLQEGVDAKTIHIIQAIKEMERVGASVTIRQVDVSDYEQLASCFTKLRAKYHKINGVIHCAGLIGQGLVMQETLIDFKKVLAPKVKGCFYLDLLTREDKLDFMVYFSSINSITGGIGQGDYVAANAFLDGYSWYRNGLGLPTISIHWPGWKEVGMAKEHNAFQVSDLLEGIHTSEATKWLGKLLDCSKNEVIVGRYQQPRRKQKQIQPQTKLSMAVEESTIEQRVASIWSQVLEIETIDIYETFSNMGGDSVLATYLYKAMEKEFPGKIFITDVFTYPTVSSMAKFIESKLNVTVVEKETEEKTEEKTEGNQENIEEILSKLAKGTLSVDEIEKVYK